MHAQVASRPRGAFHDVIEFARARGGARLRVGSLRVPLVVSVLSVPIFACPNFVRLHFGSIFGFVEKYV